MRNGDLTNQLAALVDAGMKLLAEVILAVLFGLLGVEILLDALVRLPADYRL